MLLLSLLDREMDQLTLALHPGGCTSQELRVSSHASFFLALELIYLNMPLTPIVFQVVTRAKNATLTT